MDHSQTIGTVQVTRSQFAQTLERNKSMKSNANKVLIIGGVIAVGLGIGTGYIMAATGHGGPTKTIDTTQQTSIGTATSTAPQVKVGQVYGSQDASAFKDQAEGVLLPGGIGDEGSHHIVREGGASQNVYLTSSVMDLKMFEGDKVKVFGETFQSQKAGWLMDVGRVEVEVLNAPLPAWAAALQQQQQNQQGNNE
ncbi:hypothetical protein C5B42_00905 [Candidatus Cerribacteria bacterium 'Amazon FNV 2010 28 9']|uniref:Uncharacterized protein n=1 Tax=Candidatus Cerribacteria bacterium 'Amazon FNV 2010 28 9' TaxID=2081795 RepID=A0A317JQA1_9BACT|nr:MAG: hypothetical protein C5B42_00905 [Candidatus Cerribacteria bacterium 'Amazon FNV 2010 28 9']